MQCKDTYHCQEIDRLEQKFHSVAAASRYLQLFFKIEKAMDFLFQMCFWPE